MLIDIEKFVSQMLPPNKRLPVHIALATSLFSPLNRVLNISNKFKYDSQFDTGTPGQVAVLEYILQSYVDGNIRVTDGTGSNVDFRVLVPQTLSPQKRGDVVRIIERYRLRSKRYEVVDNISWGGGGNPITQLAWASVPSSIELTDGNFGIQFAPTISGNFPTIIKLGNTVLYNETREYAAGQLVNYAVISTGIYTVQLGTLLATVEVSAGLLTMKPGWLNRIAYTHDVDTHEFTLYLDATEPVRTRIVALAGENVSGNGWNETTWMNGIATGGGFSERFHYNPLVIGQGGIVRANTYRVYVHRVSNPNVIYYKDFTTQNNSNVYPPVDIILSNPDLPDCQLGPNLDSVLSASETEAVFRFAAEEVYRFFLRIREGGAIIWDTEMVYHESATAEDRANPRVQLFYNNTPTVVYPQLAPGVSRTIEIEGSSCKSERPSVMPLVITGTALQFATGYPRYVLNGSNNDIQIRMTKSQSALTIVTDLDTNTVLYNQMYSHVAGQNFVIASVTAGHRYGISVGDLNATLYIASQGGGGGNVSYVILSHGLPAHINLEITGSDKNWVLNDRSNYPLSGGFKFVYRIGGQNYHQTTPLSNYQWRSNTPFRLLKGILKESAQGLWQWADANGITLDESISPGFTYNDSVTQCTVVFMGGASDFVNPILNGIDPSKGQVQFMDLAPNVTLPHGHGWIIQKGVYTLDQILAKGATHIPNGQLPWDTSISEVIRMEDAGLTYSDVPLNNVLFSLPRNESIPETWVSNPPGQGWPYIYNLQVYPTGPLTEQQSIDAANNTGAVHHAMHVGEAEEGWPAISTHWPMWGWFYKRVKERKIERFGNRGLAHFTCHNYFTIGMPPVFTLGSLSREAQKAAFNRPVSQWETTQFSTGGTLVDTDMICQAIYLGAPDKESYVYASVYFMEVARKLGKKGCMFFAEVHEWRPNNHSSVVYPDGVFYRQIKVPVDPADSINYGFFGQVHGHVSIHWAAKPKVTNRLMDPDYNWGDLFFRNGSGDTSPMPYYGHSHAGDRYYGYNGGEDMFNMGVLLYAQTFALVEGGVSLFLKFRIDGGAWITPVNNQMDDLIDAREDKRGYVYSREKDGLLGVYYINQYGDGSQHLLEFVNPHNPAIIWSGTVSANMVHVRMINL